jgi:hypothetical protein
MQTIVCRYDHSTHECGEALFAVEGLPMHAGICECIVSSDTPAESVKRALDQAAEVRLILRGMGQ